ncbi:hypothetical protein COZ81_02375 [Candidatus Jorgensenbacteria bacterium CG_4_8_14_3_um_filter_38_10]|nr:MAG: hypothetical protein COS46_00610 [Candidatus Jorgensenbacteria bacterium CG03_land_8_20_14_0_80_38_39]PIW97472.1 MAG: hypothetical protein COZ81_02375 [Candidatus Jorgensenbacteria bacterium CG_4_8_14_3_um_filter_38_10]
MIRDFFHTLGEIFEDLFAQWETWFFLFLLALGPIILFTQASSSGIGFQFINFLKLTWWFWFFLIFFPLTKSIFLYWRQELFKNSIKWVLLELKVPRQIEKSSQTMEQILYSLHSLRNAPGDFKEKYINGEITRWFSLEMVSFGGETHFYIRAYEKLRKMIEAAFFSYYPDIDIVEAPDYVDNLPKNVAEAYKKGLDFSGTEIILASEEVYPIKTYIDFENIEEEKKFDPISTFLEALAKLQKDEFTGIQILIAPVDPKEWKDKWEDFLEKLRKPTLIEFGKEGEIGTKLGVRSPGQTDILKAVERNLSKPAFNTLIRLLYLSPKITYDKIYAKKGLIGSFNQYAALNLNSFKPNRGVTPFATIWRKPYLFSNKRIEYRKERLLFNYKKREMPPASDIGRLPISSFYNWNFASQSFKMNTECLATLFHMPTAVVVTEPHIRHLESRRAGPPAGLSIFGEEKEIEKFNK